MGKDRWLSSSRAAQLSHSASKGSTAATCRVWASRKRSCPALGGDVEGGSEREVQEGEGEDEAHDPGRQEAEDRQRPVPAQERLPQLGPADAQGREAPYPPGVAVIKPGDPELPGDAPRQHHG